MKENFDLFKVSSGLNLLSFQKQGELGINSISSETIVEGEQKNERFTSFLFEGNISVVKKVNELVKRRKTFGVDGNTLSISLGNGEKYNYEYDVLKPSC